MVNQVSETTSSGSDSRSVEAKDESDKSGEDAKRALSSSTSPRPIASALTTKPAFTGLPVNDGREGAGGLAKTITALESDGFSRFTLGAMVSHYPALANFATFAARASRDLPPDPYDKTGGRRRRYAQFLAHKRNGHIEATPIHRVFDEQGEPKTIYLQSGTYQPDFGDVERVFASLSDQQIWDPVVHDLIRLTIQMAIATGTLPNGEAFIVGFHINQQFPRSDGTPARVSPNKFHRDGEPVTMAVLCGRDNVEGGETFVGSLATVGQTPDTVSPEGILSRFILSRIGEAYVVDDRRVAHHAEGVVRSNPSIDGHRTMILVDACPIKRVFSHEIPTQAKS